MRLIFIHLNACCSQFSNHYYPGWPHFAQLLSIKKLLLCWLIMFLLPSFVKINQDEYLLNECKFFSQLLAQNQLTQYIKSNHFTTNAESCVYKKGNIFYHLDGKKNQIILMPIQNNLIEVSNTFFKILKRKSSNFKDNNWPRAKLGYNYVFNLENRTSIFITSALPIDKKKNIIIKLVIRTI